MLGGVDGFFVRGYERLGLPRLKMADGPLGVRNYGPATAMAGGVSLAATWNPQLAERVGTEIGRDARAKGVHFLLGPGVNIYRSPMNGRNFEYFGEDPFLASRVAVGASAGPRYEVTFDLKNTGRREAAEVAEVYVSPPASLRVLRPMKQLKGFVKVS